MAAVNDWEENPALGTNRNSRSVPADGPAGRGGGAMSVAEVHQSGEVAACADESDQLHLTPCIKRAMIRV